jgi:hypothetical protein
MRIPDVSGQQNEVIDVLHRVKRDSGSRLKKLPSRFSASIWSAMTSCKVNPWCENRAGTNHAIRQIHDFYGWMAKHSPGGKCAGTLYRTEAFMRILPLERIGSKGQSKNVHIEHTVPVGVLESSLKWHKAEFSSPIELHWFLMCRSICVAFTQEEEVASRIANVPQSTNEAFGNRGQQVDNYPFRRYKRPRITCSGGTGAFA